MGRMNGRSMGLVTVFTSFLLVSTLIVADERIRLKQAVVFGDSLTDTGNTRQLFDYYRGTGKKPWFFDEFFGQGWSLLPINRLVGAMPPGGYFQGRFSNGPLASEMAFDMLGLNSSDQGQVLNLAFGGSWSVSARQFFWSWLQLWSTPDISTSEWLGLLTAGQGKWLLPSASEIAYWYLNRNERLDPETMYVMATGANDYQSGFWDVETLVAVQVNTIEQLIVKGARHIGWGTLPDLTITPCFHNSHATPKILEAVAHHNKLITQHRNELEEAFPQVKITFVDGYAAMKLFFENAGTFGFTVTDRGCTNVKIPGCDDKGGRSIIEIGDGDFEVCEKPEQFFFWDDMHPTTRAYEHMATYLCVSFGVKGYWTDCRLPQDFNREKAESLYDLLINDEASKSAFVGGKAEIEKLLKM